MPFCDALRRRLPVKLADTRETGPLIEKSIALAENYVGLPY